LAFKSNNNARGEGDSQPAEAVKLEWLLLAQSGRSGGYQANGQMRLARTSGLSPTALDYASEGWIDLPYGECRILRNTLIVFALVAATPALAQVVNEQQLESTDAGVITAIPPSDSPSGSRISRPVIVVTPKPKPTPPEAVTASGAAPKKPNDNSAAQ